MKRNIMGNLIDYLIKKNNLDITKDTDVKTLGIKIKDAYFDYLYGKMSYILLKSDLEKKNKRKLSEEETNKIILGLKTNISPLIRIEVNTLSEEEYEEFMIIKSYLEELREIGFFSDEYLNSDYIDELKRFNYNPLCIKINLIKNSKKRINLDKMGFGYEVNKLLQEYSLLSDNKKTMH